MPAGSGPVPYQNQDPTSEVTRAAQEELYANLLNHMQGAFGTESSIEMVAPNGEATPADLEAGMVLRLDASTGTFLRGLDGNNPGYFAKPAGGYSGVPADGNVYGDGILALPCLAPYRLCTNNYAADTYAANNELTVVESGDDTGKLCRGTYYEDAIVGVVARGVLEDYDKPGRDVLEFYTYWLPSFEPYSSANPLT